MKPIHERDESASASGAVTHTPGPWQAHYGWETEERSSPDPEHPDFCEVTGGSFKNGNHFSMNGHVGIANARVMAAATDMLAALKIAEADIIEDLETAGYDESECEDYPALKAIKAAIAKATGQNDDRTAGKPEGGIS